jgi:hypothetical protein
VQTFAHLCRLVFTPERFIAVVTDQIVAADRVQNPSIVLPSGEYPAERRASISESVRGQTRNLRRAFTKGIVTTTLTIAVGALAGTALRYLFGSPAKTLVYIVQGVGAAVILGATLAEVGGDLMTWDRVSIPERLNKLVFHGLYIIGTFMFVLSIAWDAA